MDVAGAGATLHFSQCSGSGSDATFFARGGVCSVATFFCSDAQLCWIDSLDRGLPEVWTGCEVKIKLWSEIELEMY